jgi:acetyl esterase
MKKYLCLPVLVLVFLIPSFAQDAPVQMKKMVYKTVDNLELYADMFYVEGQQITKAPAIALFHGGGWMSGKPEEFHEACRRYARMGFITFSFRYRLATDKDGNYPNPDITPVESTKDARSAIRWLKQHAGELNIDPEKIIVGGQSAGGQLALATALCDDVNETSDNLQINPAPVALLLFSSNVNTMEAWADYLLGDRRKEIWSISPYHNLKSPMPPAIAFHGENDDQVLFYIVSLFRNEMKKMGNYYELYTYPGRTHYLAAGNDKYATYFDDEILEKTDQFLKQRGLWPKK